MLNRGILKFFKSIKKFYTLTAKPFRGTINIGIDRGSLKELKRLRLKTDETMGCRDGVGLRPNCDRNPIFKQLEEAFAGGGKQAVQ
jgi:hypothetical protein